jgi:hypothetical protein
MFRHYREICFVFCIVLTACDQTEQLPESRVVTAPAQAPIQAPAQTPMRDHAQRTSVKTALPFETDFRNYQSLSGHRAFAVAKELGPRNKFTWAWSVAHLDQNLAEKSALKACQTSVRNLSRRGKCVLYAVNERQLIQF